MKKVEQYKEKLKNNTNLFLHEIKNCNGFGSGWVTRECYVRVQYKIIGTEVMTFFVIANVAFPPKLQDKGIMKDYINFIFDKGYHIYFETVLAEPRFIDFLLKNGFVVDPRPVLGDFSSFYKLNESVNENTKTKKTSV